MTLYEKLSNGTKEDLVNELVLVAKWARNLSNEDWNNITTGWGGLEKFVRDTLDRKFPENNDSALSATTRYSIRCPYVYRTFEDRDGPEYWCRLKNKDCDGCRV